MYLTWSQEGEMTYQNFDAWKLAGVEEDAIYVKNIDTLRWRDGHVSVNEKDPIIQEVHN